MNIAFQQVAVIGAGAMGRGIAQIAAQAGCQVFLYDTQAEASQKCYMYDATSVRKKQPDFHRGISGKCQGQSFFLFIKIVVKRFMVLTKG